MKQAVPGALEQSFEWFVVDLNPGRTVMAQFADSEPHARIRAARSRVALANHARRERNKIGEVTKINL